MPGRKHRALAILGAALIASAAIAPAAHAQSADDTSVTITEGILDLSDILVDNFAGRGVTGTLQTTTTTMDPYTVSDLRGGLGGGWILTAQATQFSDGGSNSLPQNSLVMEAPTADPATGNPAAAPVVPLTPHVLDGLTAATVATAALGTGTGVWEFTNPADGMTLTLPANVVPATYTSTVTMTLSAAPTLP